MKELFLLLLFIVGSAASIPEYHGDRRFWTIVDSNGRTKVALHVLKDPVNLMCPKDKTIAQLLLDMKLLSPVGNVKCQDTRNTLGFTILFDDQNHIRGETKMVPVAGGQKVKMFLYEKCGNVEFSYYYATETIEGAEIPLETTGRTCFKNAEPPFRQHGTNTADNFMELKVSPGAPSLFGCQVFMILPGYMEVADAPLPKAQVNPLNSTFVEKGDEYWWKTREHEWLPSAVSFVGEDVKINILNSSKAAPIYLRIGNNSAIPSFKFAFSPSCSSSKTELFLNFHDKPECKIEIETTQAGFMFLTKGAPANEIEDASKSPTLVFDEAKDLVYVKVDDPLSIQAFDTCTMAKAVSDQLVVQIAPDEGGQCDSAEVTLNRKDIERSIDVLIDRAKIVEPNITTNETENTTITAVVTAETTQESADAGFQWWWVVVPVGLLLIVLLAILITYLCIRRKRKNQKPKPKGLPPRSILNHDNEDQPKSPGVKTAIPAESPKKKEKNKKKNKKDGELDESSKGSKKSKKEKKPQLPKSKPSEHEKVDLYENLPPPMIQKQSSKPGLAVIQTERTQTEPTNDPTIETGPTQVDSQRTIPGTVEKAKPRPKLKYRSMYGAGGFGQMNEPFDYHLNEGSEYEPTINFDDVKSGSTPELQQFQHFWECIGSLSIPKRYSGIYVNSTQKGQNIYFMIRDCVAEQSKYSAFRALANRMLEPLKSDSDSGDKKYILRIFILSYEPFTMEIHYRGQCPLFLFNIFECDKCPEIAERLQKNAWLKSQSTCHEDWNTFVCRVKRTPMNTHQFLSYNGPAKPKNSEEVNHVMVVRGNKKPNKLRDCIRGCKFTDMSHANNMTIENDLKDGDPTDPTLQTQITQPSS